MILPDSNIFIQIILSFLYLCASGLYSERLHLSWSITQLFPNSTYEKTWAPVSLHSNALISVDQKWRHKEFVAFSGQIPQLHDWGHRCAMLCTHCLVKLALMKSCIRNVSSSLCCWSLLFINSIIIIIREIDTSSNKISCKS